ncbi:DUF3313 domain-containing protein [Phragmitibacter flavus]|uniref:DUF3313 domain-containing protein n=1 Tax=Phragmitibacter flavus TaxID=2576071 RepID=A0A5R8KJE2_9BACT|nr:DUF3313 family protein [Phragmitibacter flavus]TLD72377.1 DUF3313 domain-containing protein [Phragmitibacter flavus]
MRLLLFFAAISCLLMVSCRSTNQMLKARPAQLSSFVEFPDQMKKSRERAPFHKVWSSPNPEVRGRAIPKRQIFIAPVTLQHLRPVGKPLVRKEIELGSITRDEAGMAKQLRQEFAGAFARSERPRYVLSRYPGPDTVTLELALVELNPTSPKGNVVKTGLKFVIGPFAGLGGYFTKGNVAIEGKVRNSQTGELIFQFADNEADKMTLYTLRDFRAYGHADVSMKEWARQFELFTRTPPGVRVEDSFCFTLDPR